jgi:hypothetical protein
MPILETEDRSTRRRAAGRLRRCTREDVPILSSNTDFALACRQGEPYLNWENCLRKAIEEYSTWSSFRRTVNVHDYFRAHLGMDVRFLRGIETATTDEDADWEVMEETSVLDVAKDVFNRLEKMTRSEDWTGWRYDNTVERASTDVAFVTGTSALAEECRSSRPYQCWEQVMKEAAHKYKSWEAFRRTGSVTGYFQKHLSPGVRFIRCIEKTEGEIEWENLAGQALMGMLENKYDYYATKEREAEAIRLEEEERQREAFLQDEERDHFASRPAPVPSCRSAVDNHSRVVPMNTKSCPATVSIDSALWGAAETNHSRKRTTAKAPPPEGTMKKARKAVRPTAAHHEEASPERRKITCSILLLSQNLGIQVGRLDVKLKTHWPLSKLRQYVDPELRGNHYLTLNAPWEFYLSSGNFVSPAYEEHISIDKYLAEVQHESTISIRVVP